ncbi:hypothetical protein GCM10011514_31160 [Emticicia aquatilis]|uniref:Uncharacterized protein n=1 Tax=Emticicia aquatilis TaxID=1537369 RepID=A0A917DS51_9BACT|nr:hypothetical protein GCM10011514_31160 [Emticicia aquatilis]
MVELNVIIIPINGLNIIDQKNAGQKPILLSEPTYPTTIAKINQRKKTVIYLKNLCGENYFIKYNINFV